MPVPVTVTDAVAAPLPAVTRTVVDFAPPVVGLNTTLIVQADPAGTDVPHVLDSENWFVLPPESAIVVIGTASVPVFVSVSAWLALTTPTAWLANAKGFGVTAYVGTIPVPVNATV
jgi:hypothetical protein